MNLLKPTLSLAFLCISIFSFSQNTKTTDSKFAIGFSTGYNRGLGFQANFTALKPIESLPMHLRVGIGYTTLDPGNSSDARRIFINNATNGVPEKKGKAFDNLKDAYSHFGKIIRNNDLLMVKGSNATGLNRFSKKIKRGQISAI